MIRALRSHWPEYLIEAAGLGLFMIAACAFVVLLEWPGSPVHQALPAPFLRRALMGLAMGGTAITLIYSPWGRRSGAHFNPATTLTFLRLGKVRPADAAAYVLAQCVGGAAGVGLAALCLGPRVAHPAVRYAATLPGTGGALAAWPAEVVIAFVMMTMVLHVSNHPRWMGRTGLCAGALVALYITFEAPLSGMSLNPARSLASALYAGTLAPLWIYFTAPPLGMLLAAEAYVRGGAARRVLCARLNHAPGARCIFNCRMGDAFPAPPGIQPASATTTPPLAATR